MNRLLEYCKKSGYSLSLTKYLIDLFNNYSTKTSIEEQENFVNALTNTKIVLVNDIEGLIKNVKDKLREEIGYIMSDAEEFSMAICQQQGIYLSLPNLDTKTVSRTIVVIVDKLNEITSNRDNAVISHEIFHLLRSYSNDEIIIDKNEVTRKSGAIVTKMLINNGILDYSNASKENAQYEEKFVNFLGEKYSLISQMNIGSIFEKLQEIVNSGDKFNSLPSNEKNETLTLYINLLLLIKVYNANITGCLNAKNADFLERIKELYGDESKQLFESIYAKAIYDESILKELANVFPDINITEVKKGQVK